MASDFEREAMILSEFDHPNIVKLYGVSNINIIIIPGILEKSWT